MCGRPNHPEGTARQRGLQQIGCIHCALRGPAAANQCVNLINKEHSIRIHLNGIDEARNAILKISAKPCAGNQPGHVKGIDFEILHRIRDSAAHNSLCQPLNHSRLSNARLSDQDRVILGLLSQHLDNGIDFLLTPDQRFQLELSRFLCQIS